jgi:2,3-bisphosphoglycerate-dependent phosphoglycerate mutase
VLDGLDPSEIVRVEIATGVPIVFTLNADATVKSKVVLDTDTEHHGPDA